MNLLMVAAPLSLSNSSESNDAFIFNFSHMIITLKPLWNKVQFLQLFMLSLNLALSAYQYDTKARCEKITTKILRNCKTTEYPHVKDTFHSITLYILRTVGYLKENVGSSDTHIITAMKQSVYALVCTSLSMSQLTAT